ncbi:MAG: aminopeptidase P N-terminal domain-containing protein [Campylobacterota bacterium]|nr:aminopeptidase P N-terminal domain-containing protein [Campylobacterota bacterium]
MIKEQEYKKRRDKLASKLAKNSIAVLFSANYKNRSSDTDFPFRQNSNYYYMSGFLEDKSCLVFVKGIKEVKTILFVHKKDKTQELWNGERVGVEAAKKRFSVDEVYLYNEFSTKLKEYVNGKKTLYYDFNLDYSKVKILKRHSSVIDSFKNIATSIQKMRLIKSDSEIALIKKAISITKDAHHRAMRKSSSLEYEYQLQAEIEYEFKRHGAYSDAYTSIVACANAANTLHYIKNDRELVKGELILIDAGCEYKYYASDITRSIPVSGRYTEAQKELYNMVLDVQLKIIKMIKPGVKRSDLQKKAVKLLSRGMIELGILKASLKKAINKELYKKYYPHGIGHWMGIDVHDEAPYKYSDGKEIPLKKGMVLTIEPGIYIDENDKEVPKKFRGIGIRIEDDILVTKKASENLSSKIAKSVEEIESIYSS